MKSTRINASHAQKLINNVKSVTRFDDQLAITNNGDSKETSIKINVNNTL